MTWNEPNRELEWTFPLPRTHTGVALSNGSLGLLAWGGNRSLYLTLGYNGFWDHRGENDFSQRINLSELRELLAGGREQTVRERFRMVPPSPGEPSRPQQMPGARLALTLPTGWSLATATLGSDGVLAVNVANAADGKTATLRIALAVDRGLCWIDLPASIRADVAVDLLPAWHWAGDQEMAKIGIAAPYLGCVKEGPEGGGQCMFQPLPADPGLSIAWARRRGRERILLGGALASERPDDERLVARLLTEDIPALAEVAADWWQSYWSSVPRLALPEPELLAVYVYGLHKFACLTHPFGAAATLQGGWMEEYRVAPWSNDYHFNINAQMCYWPALSLGKPEHLQPLWRMMRSWFPRMRRVADEFFGAQGALMLPHATDDRGAAIGAYWQGTIDHASLAWMAQLAWLDYAHGGDEDVLREVAWPLLEGAFNGFWAMLQPTKENEGPLTLPLSVSPEYKEGSIGAWGRDSSFHLAALHCVARMLPAAARALGKPEDPRWKTVRDRLPPFTASAVPLGHWDAPDRPARFRIAVWEGQDLEMSHRHHSHLAGIYPFGTLDHADPGQREVIEESIEHWRRMGAGEWGGWSLPWAACLCARSDRADGALAWLHWLIENCVNEGGGVGISGVSGAMSNWCGPDDARRKPGELFEMNQLDAHMGLITAVHELLVQCVGGEIRVLPRVPWRWRELSFDGIHAEGGFVVGATVAGGRVTQIRVQSRLGRPLRLQCPAGHGSWKIGGDSLGDHARVDRPTCVGETMVLTAEASRT